MKEYYLVEADAELGKVEILARYTNKRMAIKDANDKAKAIADPRGKRSSRYLVVKDLKLIPDGKGAKEMAASTVIIHFGR